MMWELFGEITNISYKKIIETPLKTYELPSLNAFNINQLQNKFILSIPKEKMVFAINKWISPKRTRSYPYARVYDCLNQPVMKIVAIVPIVKDEGEFSNTDYLQWDTIALLSLLNVYVIISYYSEAQCAYRFSESKRKNIKILKNQKLDNSLIIEKLRELKNYQASALHWNLNELSNIEIIVEKAKKSYEKISKICNINLSSIKGLDKILKKLKTNLDSFKHYSRMKAQKAQHREISFKQPKELIDSKKKAKITIKNYLGGLYFFTVDEFEIKEDICFLIEAKHSKKKIPTEDNIKDALLKLILYTNLDYIKIDNYFTCKNFKPVLKLTTNKISGVVKNGEILANKDILKLIPKRKKLKFFKQLIKEAQVNNFEVWMEGSYV